ncbi:MAG: hypothetical protein ACLPV8_09990 [Steroidobacteraceae bacterium]
MHSSNLGFQSKFAAVPLALLLLTLWLALHGYHGLTDDGQIYAFQAFARLHPELTADLYLQNTSQDQFTLFSPLYAWCIRILGLENAARLLTLVFTVWFLAASLSFASAVAGRATAWLAVAFLSIVAGDYGGSGVFRMLDPFLTARLPAEALVITALGCHFRGLRWLGLLLALAALFIHPLMALPGLLLVFCLWLPVRVGLIGAIAGVSATLAIAVVAVSLPAAAQALTVMDAPWLGVVRERSQFLFLQLWSIHDWDINAQPFISLGFTAIAVTDDRLRKLCMAAALVAAAGLAVAFIGDFIGPVAIMVQGQAWRWVWIAVFVGAALVPVTVFHVWRDEKCGPLCALLLVSAWTMPGVGRSVWVLLALIVWSTRIHISSRLATYLRWASAALGVAVVVWVLRKFPATLSYPLPPSARPPWGAVQSIFTLRVPAVLLAALVWWGTRAYRRTWTPALLSALLIGLSIYALPAAFKQPRTLAAAVDIHEFADWANAIPRTSTVLVAPPRDVGAFVWFTLGRPNYLALDQSTGVVFSRATALEVRRRSDVLMPLQDPDWMILTGLSAKSGSGHKNPAATRPLTAENLIQVCADPQLGFVISPQSAGFDPLRHEHAGAWKDWNLYDCRKVRSAPSAT